MRPSTTNGLPPNTPSLAICSGELSGGRSATSPTRSRSTSCRTRIDRQNSQVVWTALDQRNLIGAPQFGQFAILSLICVMTFDPANLHRSSPQLTLEVAREVPIRPRLAAKYVQAN